MTTFRYPENDFDNSEKLLNLMGSFWATSYQGNMPLEDLAGIAGQLAQQTHRQFLELVCSISRIDVPIFHQDNWYGLVIRESELNTAEGLKPTYQADSESQYQATTSSEYGQLPAQNLYSVVKPADLHNVKAIFNRLSAPSVEWIQGIDFQLLDSVITFREDPFANPLMPVREILDNQGNITDRECTLWLYRGQWDWNTLYSQFGYALRLQLQSSDGYKRFINAIFDAFTAGTSAKTQQTALAAAFGVPTVNEAREIVELVVSDADKLNIITDRSVYEFPIGTTPIVAVGDELQAGDPLTDLFEIFELNQGKLIDPQDISALTVGDGLLAWGYWGDLTFENKEVPLLVELDVNGYTKISWELGGFPYDVEKFWEDVHQAGIAVDETLAMLLDTQSEAAGQPTAASLPASVNPLQFLASNLLRNNVFVLKVKAGSHRTNPLAFVPVEQLRKIQPPHTVMILIVELVYSDSPVIMEGPGTALDPGYEETIGGFPCMVASDTVDPDSFVTERVRISTIGGRCV